jgi:hypothetical protein
MVRPGMADTRPRGELLTLPEFAAQWPKLGERLASYANAARSYAGPTDALPKHVLGKIERKAKDVGEPIVAEVCADEARMHARLVREHNWRSLDPLPRNAPTVIRNGIIGKLRAQFRDEALGRYHRAARRLNRILYCRLLHAVKSEGATLTGRRGGGSREELSYADLVAARLSTADNALVISGQSWTALEIRIVRPASPKQAPATPKPEDRRLSRKIGDWLFETKTSAYLNTHRQTIAKDAAKTLGLPVVPGEKTISRAKDHAQRRFAEKDRTGRD